MSARKFYLPFLSFLVFIQFSCTTKEKTTTSSSPSLDEMIGQMILIGFRGMHFQDVSNKVKSQIQNGELGGLILFDYDVETKKPYRNISSPGQVKGLIDSLKMLAPTPLLIAVDQEGGRVNRLKAAYGFPESVSAKYLGTLNNLDSTRHYAQINAHTLKTLGFNVNYSPVVDVDLNPDNPVIGGYERSYSDNIDVIVKHASAWIKQHDSLGIISTLKHFPGHGSSSSDSHAGFTDVSNLWQKQELLPFQQLSQMDADIAIMTAHVFNNQLDSVYPATLSESTIKGIIRDQWSFDGLLFSDDLQMGAVNDLYDFETIITRSILAGVDVLVFGNNLKYDESIPEKVIATIKNLINEGTISEERIGNSYERILRYKSQLEK